MKPYSVTSFSHCVPLPINPHSQLDFFGFTANSEQRRTCPRSTENKDDSDLVGIKDGRIGELDCRRVGGGRLGVGSVGSGSGVLVVMRMELVLDSVDNSHPDL